MIGVNMATGNDDKLDDEQGRLLALHRYGVLDSLKEPNFDAITTLVKELVGVPICAVSLVDADRQWFKSTQGLDVTETPRSQAFCHHTIRTHQPMCVPDATRDPRFAANPLVTGEPHIRSYAGHPLLSPDGYNLGSLCVIDREPRDFGPTELALLRRFAALVVDQLELRTLAHRDFLTGALTRRAFVDTAISTLHQAARENAPAWVLLLDIDHFKQVNDRFGHPAGDQVLKAVASVLKSNVRPADVFGRYGGEEFALLLPNVEAQEAFEGAERLRNAVASLQLEGLPQVTASFGLNSLQPGASLEEALAQADCALYAAKRAGRNRCHVAEGAELRQAA
jgi:diguanylate cyclase (GGDEF)-like protein